MISHENCDWFQANNSTIKNQQQQKLLSHKVEHSIHKKNHAHTYTTTSEECVTRTEQKKM